MTFVNNLPLIYSQLKDDLKARRRVGIRAYGEMRYGVVLSLRWVQRKQLTIEFDFKIDTNEIWTMILYPDTGFMRSTPDIDSRERIASLMAELLER